MTNFVSFFLFLYNIIRCIVRLSSTKQNKFDYFWKITAKKFGDSKKSRTFASAFAQKREHKERVLWKIYIDRSSTRSECLYLLNRYRHLGIRNKPSIITKGNWELDTKDSRSETEIKIRVIYKVPRNERNESLLSIAEWRRKLVKILSKIQFLQWRVWSWLRMNASYRLNTCKSRGIEKKACFLCRRPAHGWVTRIQPSP